MQMRILLAAALVAIALMRPAFADPIRSVAGHDGTIFAMAFRPDGAQIATGGFDRTVRIWDANTGGPIFTLYGHHAAVTAVAFSPDGKTLVSGDSDGNLLLWRPTQSNEPRRLEGHPNCVYAIAFHPSGESFFSCSQERRVIVWRSSDGELRKSFGLFSGPLYTLVLSPDGSHFATAGRDGSIVVCDAGTGRVQGELTGHTGEVFTLAFLARQQLVSGSQDTTVRVWDIESGNERYRLAGHRDAVYHASSTALGQRLLTIGVSGQTVIWDAASGAPLFSHRLPGPAHCGGFAPDGESVVVGTGRGEWFRLTLPARAR
jgi:WD40 repeat protein